jgi:hypothetical protein
MKKIILFCFFLVLISDSFSQTERDTLFFNNGGKLIGKIKKVKLGVVTFDPDDAGDITVQLRRIKTMAAVRAIFRVETVNGNALYGKLFSDTDSGYAKMVNGFDTTMIYLQDISVLYPSGNAFLQRFAGNVGLGYNYTRSSNFGRLNYDGNITYTYKKEVITLAFSGIYTTTDTSFSRDNENLYIKYNHYFTPTWFTTGFLNYQRNLELGLQRRYQEGLGIGNKFVTTQHIYAWVRSGFVINQEKSTEDFTTGTLGELFGQLEFNFFRFTKPKIDLLMSQSFYYSMSQNRFRNDGNTNMNWEIIKNFKIRFEFYNNYDSRPPVEGNSQFDFGVLFGVSYYFY